MEMKLSDTVYEVKKIWLMLEMYEQIQDLIFWISGGSTGGEIFSRVYGMFNKIKSENSEAYLVAKDFIDIYLDAGNKQGVPYINWDNVLK